MQGQMRHAVNPQYNGIGSPIGGPVPG